MNFYMPTRIVTGKDCVKNSSDLFKNIGKRAIIVTGRSSAKKCGALDDVITALKKACREYVIYDKIDQNPKIESCIEAGALAKEFTADFVIGIGGGSPLDAAKAIAVLAVNNINEKQFYALEWEKALPIIAVGTTAGTGSEVTQVAVITNSDGMKKSIRHDLCFPVIAFGDATYTTFLNDKFTRSTAADALAHCIESYFNETATDVSKTFAMRGTKILVDAMKEICSGNEVDFSLRERLYKASLYGGLAISVTGTCFPHALGYFLSEDHEIAHGTACAFYLPEFISHNQAVAKEACDEFFSELGITARELTELIIEFSPEVSVVLSDDEKKALSPRWQNNSSLKKTLGKITPEFLENIIEKLF
ncbi:MAG: iron-containing alcohol dehydrogenase [Clostridia bacterium]|nr:iron-containing alcohol dehydrogenase [Clostridia bacterium]